MTEHATAQVQKTGPTARRQCWECKAIPEAGNGAETHFCPQCGKIQPLAPQTTYFSFFGLARKLGLDAAQLEKQFHELSWKLHPDSFHNASPYEQELSLERTAILNDAFRTLRDPVARVAYLLGLEGVRKEGEVKQQAPPDLLEEVFELNEYLEELRLAKRSGSEPRELEELRHRLGKARETFQQKLDAVLEELSAQFVLWDQLAEANPAEPPAQRAGLERMSEILNRHSYIRNLVANVTDELET